MFPLDSAHGVEGFTEKLSIDPIEGIAGSPCANQGDSSFQGPGNVDSHQRGDSCHAHLSITGPPASRSVFLISERKGFPKNFSNSSRRSSRKSAEGRRDGADGES